MKNLRNQFPILEHTTYLNTAASGIFYESLIAYRHELEADLARLGSGLRDRDPNFFTEVADTIASFTGNQNGETVLASNFSTGLHQLLEGIPKSKTMLLLEGDYPSLLFAVESRGFTTITCPSSTHPEDALYQIIRDKHPDFLLISKVQYTTGIMISEDFFQTIKKEFPDLIIIVDGTQFIGTEPFNFNTSAIDVLGCSGYKWLLSGYGNGFFLMKKEISNILIPEIYKKAGLHSPFDASYTSMQAYFAPGHLDILAFGSLQYSLRFLSEIGLETIQTRVQDIVQYAKLQFEAMGILRTPAIQTKPSSPILSISGDISLYNKLKSNAIITSLRGEGLRISCHFYTTKDDIDRCLSFV